MVALPDLLCMPNETRCKVKFARSNTPCFFEWKGAKNMCSCSRAKSRDDIMALMHVTYTGVDALPPQQDTEL